MWYICISHFHFAIHFVIIAACNFTESNAPPCVFFTFFKLYKWYQVAQSITNSLKNDAQLETG